MSDSLRNLHLQWKGVTTGPHTRDEVEEMLSDGKISLVHRVGENGRWQSVSEFLERRNRRIRALDDTDGTPAPVSPAHPKSIESPRHAASVERLDKLVLIGYVLCGTAFVLPAFATIAALWIAFRIQSLGAREPARLQFILCAIFTFLGLFFWLLLWITR